MRLGEGVEWAVHCCVVLSVVPPDRAVPASRLAEFHGLPGPYLAKHLQALAAAGIVESIPGRRGGYRLARPASAVTMLEIVEAVEGRGSAFRCTEIRQRGPAADQRASYRKPCTIARIMWQAEAAWQAELAAVTIAELAAAVGEALTPVSIRRTAAWLQNCMR